MMYKLNANSFFIVKFLKVLISIGLFISFTGCLEMNGLEDESENTKLFEYNVNVENGQKKFALGDTLWFKVTMPNSLIDINTGLETNLVNASYILTGEIRLLLPTYDSLRFLDNNFDLIIDKGELELINVVESNYAMYQFKIKFGEPNGDTLRMGVIPRYLGVFACECSAVVYFGESRDDYNDYSDNHEYGIINLTFNTDDINKDVYYDLPPIYQQYYDSYYTEYYIEAKKFYFIKVLEKLNKR